MVVECESGGERAIRGCIEVYGGEDEVCYGDLRLLDKREDGDGCAVWPVVRLVVDDEARCWRGRARRRNWWHCRCERERSGLETRWTNDKERKMSKGSCGFGDRNDRRG
jgi:hypothetical protein